MAHSTVAGALAAGMKALPDTRQAFAHTQALWRFLAKDQVDVAALSGPIMALACAEVPHVCPGDARRVTAELRRACQ